MLLERILIRDNQKSRTRTPIGTQQALPPKVAWKINYWSVSCQKKVMNSRILISSISIFCLATNLNFFLDVVWRCMHALLAYALPLWDKPVSGISPGFLVSMSCIRCSFSYLLQQAYDLSTEAFSLFSVELTLICSTEYAGMGVQAFFRWLTKKYPSIVVHCVEEKVSRWKDW